MQGQSASEHLRLQRRWELLILNVIRVDGRRRCGRGGVLRLWRKAFQNALHLLLHLVRPVYEVALQLAGLLHDLLLPFPEPRQRVHALVALAESAAAGGCSGGLWPLGGRLARHMELKLLRAQVQRLAVQLLDEGHGTALGKGKEGAGFK